MGRGAAATRRRITIIKQSRGRCNTRNLLEKRGAAHKGWGRGWINEISFKRGRKARAPPTVFCPRCRSTRWSTTLRGCPHRLLFAVQASYYGVISPAATERGIKFSYCHAPRAVGTVVTGIERTHCRPAAVIFIDGPARTGLTRGKMDIPFPKCEGRTHHSLRLLGTTPTDFHRFLDQRESLVDFSVRARSRVDF